MTAKLVVEHRPASPIKVLESTEGGVMRFEAVVSEVDFVNRNGRRYPREVLWPAFETMKENLAKHPGLVDHPGFFDPASISGIGLMWEDFFMEGHQVIGRARIVNTQRGRDLAAAIEAGVAVGFSTRGYGSGEQKEIDGRTVYELTDYSFSPDGSVDAVINPSVHHARLRGFTKEELDQMNEELQKAKADLEAANSARETAEAALAEANGRVGALETERTDLQNEIEGLRADLEAAQAELVQFRADQEASQLEAKLVSLTSEHRFGATIRAEVNKLRESGLPINGDNLEVIVTNLTALVEGAAGAANEGSEGEPRGDLQTEEDTETPTVELTEEEIEQLRNAGLL
jgi:hypothetical protein